MPFTYNPEDVKEREIECLEPGVYKFETISCKEDFTKSGIDKLILKIHVFDDNGDKWEHVIHVTHKNVYHLKKYWSSVGEPNMFNEMGKKHSDGAYLGKCGSVKTKIDIGTYEGRETKRSVVHYFIEIPEKEKFIEDDVPFQ